MQKCGSCRYYGCDENGDLYCKKDYNSYREPGAECNMEDDTKQSHGSSSTSGTSNSNSTSSSGSSGCYVATAVYGSFDCPEVWTLRRFRDYELTKTLYGRVLVRIYYAVSPILVKWFGNTKWFRKLWKKPLDKIVRNLQDKGFDSTPYRDNGSF